MGWDPNKAPTGMGALFPQPFTLAQWLYERINGNLHQPMLVRDSVTHEWRGATGQEWEQWIAELADE
jgi:hypothetical protein